MTIAELRHEIDVATYYRPRLRQQMLACLDALVSDRATLAGCVAEAAGAFEALPRPDSAWFSTWHAGWLERVRKVEGGR